MVVGGVQETIWYLFQIKLEYFHKTVKFAKIHEVPLNRASVPYYPLWRRIWLDSAIWGNSSL